ncbi:MAG: hypothetical protein EB043_03770 [Actinobacteria bacterium]|nr:hypothetical protein [Actinomycetota bacterium]
MGIEEKLPSGFLLTTVEKLAAYMRYAIVQGVDHIIPVDIYLPGCPPRPEMLMDAILKLHEQIKDEKLGVNRKKVIAEVEKAALAATPTHQIPAFGASE